MKSYRFKIFGHDFETKVIRRDGDEVVINVNGQEYTAKLEPKKGAISAKPTPKVVRPTAAPGEGTKITAQPSAAKGAGVVRAPMPGLILKVNGKEGDIVKTGDTVIIMEAMKMQNQIQASINGKITKISCQEGDSVLEGEELLMIG